jgi:hypothetical protein
MTENGRQTKSSPIGNQKECAHQGQRTKDSRCLGSFNQRRARKVGLHRGVVTSAGRERTSEEITMDTLEQRWYELDFSVSRSLRYHAKRRRFFETWLQIIRVITAFAGAGTVATLFGDKASGTTAIFGAVVAAAAAIDLVFEFARRSMIYDHLYRCFADLGAEIAEADQSSEAEYKKLLSKRRQIEREEPTGLDVLNVICSNEVRESKGYDYKYKVRYLQGLFAQFGDFGKQDFPKVSTIALDKLPPPKASVH